MSDEQKLVEEALVCAKRAKIRVGSEFRRKYRITEPEALKVLAVALSDAHAALREINFYPVNVMVAPATDLLAVKEIARAALDGGKR